MSARSSVTLLAGGGLGLLLPVVGLPQAWGEEEGGTVTSAVGNAAALEPRGRISLRDAFLTDNSSEHTTNLLSVDLDVFVPRIKGTGLSILFDGEFRQDLSSHPEQTPQEKDYDQLDPHTGTDGKKQEYLGRSERTFGQIRKGTFGDYIRSAYLEYAGVADVLAFQGGRMLLTDLGQTWVDGLVVRAGRERGWLAGAFGGLSPAPLDYSLSLDYQTFGVFGGWTGDGWLVRLAFNESLQGGETDRRFLFSSGHFGIFDKVFLSYGATVDLAGQEISYAADDWQGANPIREDLGPLVTMGYANLLWWATPQLSLTLSGSTYTNVPFRLSQSAYLPTEFDRDVLQRMLENKAEALDPSNLPSWSQRLNLGDGTAFPAYYSFRASPAIRFAESFYGYVSFDYRTRELDGESAKFLSTGVRSDDLFRSGLAARLEYTARNNFLSDSNELFLALDYKFFNRVELGLFGTVMDGRSMAKTFGRDLLLQLREAGLDVTKAADHAEQRIAQRQRVWLVGATLDIDITKRLYLLLDYDLTLEELIAEDDQEADDLVIHGLNARLTWRL